MNTKFNSFGCRLVYVGGEESTRKGKTRGERQEKSVKRIGWQKVWLKSYASCKPMMSVDNSKTNGPSKVTIIFSEKKKIKNILQQQQFFESLAGSSGPIRIPSSVMTFAVIHSLGLMRHVQHVVATNRFESSGEFLWKSLSLQQNLVAAKSRTNSVWFYFFLTCCSDKILLRRQRFSQKFSSALEAICCCDVSPHRVAATCRPNCTHEVIYRRNVLLQLVS